MPDDVGFDRMVRAAIRAHRLMRSHGTPAMQLLSRLLLMEIGIEVATLGDRDPEADDKSDESDE